jgi:cyclic pyranopterin phosphate synthase
VTGELSHVDASGNVRMVDVGAKPALRRRAVARARVTMAAETARRLRELPKGDAIVAAQLAGIMAAKRTSDLIPLCHPLPLTNLEVEVAVSEEASRSKPSPRPRPRQASRWRRSSPRPLPP